MHCSYYSLLISQIHTHKLFTPHSTHTRTHVGQYTHTHARAHAYTYARAHTHTHTHTQTRAQTQILNKAANAHSFL